MVLKSTHHNRRGLPTVIYRGPTPGGAGASVAAAAKKDYDVAGRVVGETDEIGVVRKFGLDGIGRIETLAVEWKAKKSGISWESFDPAQHVTTDGQYARYGYEKAGGQVSIRYESEGITQYGYDALGRKIETFWPDGRTEEITYDIVGRVLVRRLPAGNVHKYTYRDDARAIDATFQTGSAASIIKSTATFDWDGKLLDLTWPTDKLSPSMPFGIQDANVIRLHHEYGDFGKLKSKQYHEAAAKDSLALAEINYESNDADLRSSIEITLNKKDGTRFVHKDTYAYDANLRLLRIDGGGHERFTFVHNRAGLLKELGRPMPVHTTGDKPKMTNVTSFSHDQMGRVTKLVERAGLEAGAKALSQFDFMYDGRRSKEQWDPQNPTATWEPDVAWDIGKLDFLPQSPALKGLRYERFTGVPNIRNVFVQDFAYAGDGHLFAHATKFRASRPAAIPPWFGIGYGSGVLTAEQASASFFSEARITDWDDTRTNMESTTNYRVVNFEKSILGNVSYTDGIEMPAGRPTIRKVYRRRTPIEPAAYPLTFQQQNQYGPDHELADSYIVSEDLAAASNNKAATATDQVHKFYFHDSAGNLGGILHRSEQREG